MPKGHDSLDLALGWTVTQHERGMLTLQADAWNLTDRLNVINFSGLFSGTALATPRSGGLRVTWEF